jgi:hypothetical protein
LLSSTSPLAIKLPVEIAALVLERVLGLRVRTNHTIGHGRGTNSPSLETTLKLAVDGGAEAFVVELLNQVFDAAF